MTTLDQSNLPRIVRVPGAAKLGAGESLRFSYQRSQMPAEGFVLCWAGELRAFANSCPHWNVDLDYGSGDFFDVELERIVCRNHGALFMPDTGACEWGPCTGQSLERFAVTIEGDDAIVHLP